MRKLRRPLISLAAFALLLGLVFFWRSHPVQKTASQTVELASVGRQNVPLLTQQTMLAAPVGDPAHTSANAPTPTNSFLAFDSWAADYLGAPSETARADLLREGEHLAQARRKELAQVIQSDPQRALELAVSYGVRKRLPATIKELLEERVSGRGDFSLISCTPLPGRESEVPPDFRRVAINHRKYEAFVYGRRLQQRSQSGISIHGVAVDKYLAVSADPLRLLEPEEASDVLAAQHSKLQPACGVCGEKPALDSKPTLAELGGKIIHLCRPSEAAALNKQLSEAESRLAPHVPTSRTRSAASAPLSAASPLQASSAANSVQAAVSAASGSTLPISGQSRSQGRKRLLLMPVLFADDPRPPSSIDAIYALGESNNRFFVEGSYDTASFDTTVTPFLRLPEKKIYYGEFLDFALLGDAETLATSLGYDISFYDFRYVLFTSIAGVTFGGRSDGLVVGGGGAISHELGHNFGLAHANFWDTRGNRPLPVQPAPPLPPYPFDQDSLVGHDDINAPTRDAPAGKNPPDEEYGDIYDVMGSGGGHFSAAAKYLLNWLPDQFTRVITQSETNRVYAFDTPSITAGRLYALRIRKDFERTYWASYRQGFPNNPWLSSGIELTWENWPGTAGSVQLLDTTPGTTAGKNDAAVVVGRTYADPPEALYLTPVAKGGATPGEKWIDVVVQIGPFPTNVPPVLTLSASELTVTNGTTVTFTATADDPNGDALAYYWDFSDQTFGTNSRVNIKTFFNDGQYVVRCEASDMKGGVASAYVVVVVGNPTTFTMSGQVTDLNGNPIQGARVHNCGSLPPYVPPDPYKPPPPPTNGTYRYSYTDSQGYYTIGNIPPGTYTNRAFIYGYRTDPSTFADPTVLDSADALNLDHIATPLTSLIIQRQANAFEGGPIGKFKITRAGDTNQDLPVRFALSGTAVQGIDYQPLGSITTNITFTTNGSVVITNTVVATNDFGSFTIRAGSSSTNLNVVAIEDSSGTGPKTVEVTLLLQTNDFRISTMLTNIVSTNAMNTNVVVTNTFFVSITNQVSIPGWELLPSGPSNQLTWFQTYPTYVLATAEAAVTIFDNDPPDKPTVAVFTLDTDSIETVYDSATVTFVRFGGSVESNLVVNYSLSGTASNGVDYQKLSGSIIIPAGQRAVNLPIVGILDLFVEGDQTVDVTIGASPLYSIGGARTEIILVNDNLPLISIYSTDSSAVKTGGNGTVTLEREGDLTQDLLVNYLVTGTAVSGVDYQVLSGSTIIPAGQITTTISIRPINRANPAPSTVTLLLSPSTTYNISSLNNKATVTILDQLPVVTISGGATVVEGAGTPALFTVSRTGATNTGLLVNFEVGGSAIEGADYSSVGRSVTIPVGSVSATIPVLPIGDPFNEYGDISLDDTVIVQLAPGSGYSVGSPSSAIVVIGNDDPLELPAVGFLLSHSSGREDIGAAQLAVRISANPTNTKSPALIDYKVVTGGSAIQGVNYSFTGTGTLSFFHYTQPNPPPQFHQIENSVQFITIPLLNDDAITGNKSFTVTLFTHVGYITNYTTNMTIISTNITEAPTNCYVGDYRSHTFTIIDIGAAVVDIQATTPLAYEEGTRPGVFTVTRSGSTSKPLTVNFGVSGTAASGSDYVPFGNSVTIPAGTNAATITVVPNDDPTEELAETVTVTLLDGPGFSIGNGRDTIIIVDNDGTIQFSMANYQVNEGDGTALIGVQRSGDTNRLVTVDYLVNDGTATKGVDYSATNGRLTFNPGEILQTFSIQIINNSLVQPTRTISLVLTNPTGGVPLGGQKTATLFILDDDTAFVFATNNFRVNENGANAVVNINRIGLTNATNTVTFWTTDGSATNALDYRGVTNNLIFLPGDANKTVLIPIIDDALLEGNETVLLHLTNAIAGSPLGGSNSATLTIVDDECALQFSSPTYSVEEYAGFVTLVVQRVGGTINPVSVDYHTVDGTAIGTGPNGPDFLAASGTLFFRGDQFLLATNGSGNLQLQIGDTSQTILVPIIDNTQGGGNKTFSVVLNNPKGPPPPIAFLGSTTLGTPSNAVVTIIDDETPGNVDHQFNPGTGPNDRVLALALQADLSIVFGGDFTTVDGISFNRIARLQPNGNLDPSFNPGAGIDGTVDAVAMQADTKILVGGSFSRVDSTNRANLARLNADGNLDLSFAPAAAPNGLVRALAVQANGQILVGGDFTQPRSHLARLNPDGSLDAAFSPAVAGSVYTLGVQADGRIVLGGAFTGIGASVSPSIGRLNTNGTLDATFNTGKGPNGIVASLALQSDGRVVIGGRFTQFNGTNANYLARLLSTGALDPDFSPGTGPDAPVNSVAVHSSGKILLGGDFTSFNGASRNRFARLTPSGFLDNIFNVGAGANDSVRAILVQPDSAVVIGGDFTQVEGLPRNHLARIHGDERSDLTSVSFSAASYSVSEGAGAATITVVRSGNTNRAFSISFSTTNGTTTPFADYIPTNGVLNFGSGDLTRTFNVKIIDDTLIEDNETIFLFLTNAPGGVDLSGISAAVLTIVDNEKSIRFSSTNYFVNEGGSNAIITLTRQGPLIGAVSVTFSTTDGTAMAGADYLGITNVVNFADGQSNQTVLVPIIDDSITEGPETVNLMLSNPSGDVQLGLASSVLVIIDNEPGPGGVEPGFATGAGANNFVRSLALQRDGRILAGGGFTSFDNVPRNYVARLNANGALDLTFDPGTGADASVASVASLPDGRAVLGGAFTTINGTGYNRLGRLLANGAPDPSFNQVAGFNASVNVVALQADGRVLAGGGFSVPAHDITELLPAGSIDFSFNPGNGFDGPVHCALIQTNGQILLGGAFGSVNGFPCTRVARLNANGSVDSDFVTTALTNGSVYAMALQSDGKIVIGGDFYTTSNTNRVGLARLNADGSLDATFDPGSGANAAVFAVAVLPSGKIIVGGSFTTFNNVNRNRLVRLRQNGSVDTAFDPGTGPNNTVFAVIVLPDSNLLIGGAFNLVNGLTRNGVARIKSDDLDPAFLSIALSPGNPVQMTLRSQNGSVYVLEASQDLINWVPIRTNTASGPTLVLSDPAPNPGAKRFYRAREL